MRRMKMMINKRVILTGLIAVFALVGCGGGGGTTNSNDVVLPSSYTQNSGRLLGSVGCAQCHGTNGISKTSWDSIAGEGEFAKENFNEHPIMQAIANGYNQTEKNIIDSWLNSMPEREDD